MESAMALVERRYDCECCPVGADEALAAVREPPMSLHGVGRGVNEAVAADCGVARGLLSGA